MAFGTPHRRPTRIATGIAAAIALVAAGGAVVAQGGAGIGEAGAAADSSGSFEVGGIDVDVRGKDANAARMAGWRIAQRQGWDRLSRRLTGRAGSLSDSALDSLVTGIVVEQEQIGPNRYVARLGVLFSRARAGQMLGVGGIFTRSPPMLVVPLEISGAGARTFEAETPWQQAWGRFRSADSRIDYVRLTGTGPDSLLLNAGQVDRRGRGWWRTILDQYGARDILVPQARIYRQWPGGPVVGVFIAGHGPDNAELARFTLRVRNADGLPALLDEGIRRIDAAYQSALASGVLRSDQLLAWRPAEVVEEVEEEEAAEELVDVTTPDAVAPGAQVFTVQYDSPGVGAVSSAEASLRGVPGVRSALTSSLALGGVSVMRVNYEGNLAGLRAALEARGWQVQEGPGTLRIRRAGAPEAPIAAPEPPAE